jgi:predicted transcriptional regulator
MDERVGARFGEIWPVHVSSLARFLIACRGEFDGDLDLFLIMTIVGDRTFAETRATAMSLDQFMAGKRSLPPPEPINMQSISDFSGIPRETVRRKLKRLIEKGWIRCDEKGLLTATRQAATDLEPLTKISVKYISSMLRMLETTQGRPRSG